MVTQSKPTPKSFDEFISSFQVLDIVSEALSQIVQGNDAATVTPTVSRIHQKFKQCEQILDNLPGGSMTRREQIEEIQRLRENLQRKRQLLDRYAKHDVISRTITQKSMLPSNAETTRSVTTNPDQNPSLDHDSNPVERPQTSNVPHVVNENENDIKMDDFGDISGVADSLPKDDVLMGLDI